MKSGQRNHAKSVIPTSPIRQIVTVFHCAISSLGEIIVPMWVMMRKIEIVAPIGMR